MKTAMVKERQIALIQQAEKTKMVEGEAAECGVWQGGNLLNIARALPHKIVYGFDTFTGLPEEKWSSDDQYLPRQFADTSMEQVALELAGHSIRLVKGLFPESAAPFVGMRFAFVHLDLDLYLSTLEALRWFMPRMSDGGIIVFDDYDNPKAPGIRRAIDECGLVATPTWPLQAAVVF